MKGIASIRKVALTSRKIAQFIAEFASDKKAEEIVILDMKKIVNFCDYFVLCTGNSETHIGSIADGIEENFVQYGVKLKPTVNRRSSGWVVLDTGDVVTHVFLKPIREFYNLEYLWREAKLFHWNKS